MFNWFTKRAATDPSPRASETSRRLAAYPPVQAPHRGPPARWTDAQARENLAQFLARRDERLAGLATWLDGEGIDVRPALEGSDWRPVLDALHRWANDTWPALHDARIASDEAWLRMSWHGPEVVYALLADLALLIGEVVIRRDPRFGWDLNLDDGDGRDGMASYRRVVLCLDVQAPAGVPRTTEDVEAMVVHRYHQPRSQLNRRVNAWAQLVQEALSGALDPR